MSISGVYCMCFLGMPLASKTDEAVFSFTLSLPHPKIDSLWLLIEKLNKFTYITIDTDFIFICWT